MKKRMEFDDKIVISGISGRFPESSNLAEWEYNLFNGIDMITVDDRRFTSGLYGIPKRAGKLKELDKFDAAYFGIHPKQAHIMDPQLRLLLELTHEAILDAGVNPMTIRGSKTGVFVGQSFSESEHSFLENPPEINPYMTVGCMKAMFANRISYAFDFKGPSISLDTACSSSLMALEQAVSAIKAGHCDKAIVGGVNICLNPSLSLAFQKLGVLSQDGKCKAFDATANGYARSEAAVVIFIQKVQEIPPPRVYATILHAKTNVDGYKAEGPTFPSGHMQQILMSETYDEAGVNPCQVSYVEAHGTGTKAGDSEELKGISEVFLKNRDPTQPLLIGSVKSNIGHSEPASGLCSIAKVCLSAKRGELPGNLHFKTPNPNIPALLDGRLKVVTETTKWPGGIVGVSSFGFGGANVHIILETNPDTKSHRLSSNQSLLPLIVPISGRTRSAVEFALNQITNMDKMDEGMLALLHEISLENIPGHSFRGFSLFDGTNEPAPATILDTTQTPTGNQAGKNPPVWFVYSGMGSQCLEIGQDLMTIPIFRDSILKSGAILKSHGFELLHKKLDGGDENENYFFTPKLKDCHNGVTHDFVQITAIQLALTDLLTGLGIFPEGILGHSIGEVACGYADGCVTREEAILTSFYRGKAIEACQFSEGAMAAVGMSWEEALDQCPPSIFPACHNSIDSVTVSGPQKDVENFVRELKSKNIFAKMVDSSGQAFHSPYIKEAGPPLKSFLEKILDPSHWTKRTNRWLNTSTPKNCPPCGSSVDYFVQNLLSPVHFQDAVAKIPSSAIVIEIAPHAILAAILKKSLPSPTNTILSIVNKNRLKSDSALWQLCKSIGCLYINGLNPRWSALYQKIKFPVPTTTGCISPLIQWDHGTSWHVAKFETKASSIDKISNFEPSLSSSREKTLVKISLEDPLYEFFGGHQIDGRVLIPATGYLVIIWKVFAQLNNHPSVDEMAVVFENVQFSRATILPSKGGGSVTLTINIFESTGEFQIHEGQSLTAKGFVKKKPENLKNQDDTQFQLNGVEDAHQKKKIPLNSKDIYKSLHLRGYKYDGVFRGIVEADSDGCNHGYLKWAANWSSFLDTMIQFSLLTSRENLMVPTFIKFVSIDPIKFLQEVVVTDGDNGGKKIPIFYSKISNMVTCPGIQFRGRQAVEIPRRPPQATQSPPLLDEYKFALYFDPMDKKPVNLLKKMTALRFCVDIALENMTVVMGAGKTLVDVTEILDENNSMAKFVLEFIKNHPHFDCRENFDNGATTITTTKNQLVIFNDFSKIQDLVETFQNSTFLLYHGPQKHKKFSMANLNLICQKMAEDDDGQEKIFCLWRKQIDDDEKDEWHRSRKLIFVDDDDNGQTKRKFEWVKELKDAMMATSNKNPIDRICIIAHRDKLSGILGLVNCLRQEPGGDKIRCYFIRQNFDHNFENFLDHQLIQLFKSDLVMNVYDEDPQNGQIGWGSFRHFSLTDDIKNYTLSTTADQAYIDTMTRGDLSSLQWVQAPSFDQLEFSEKKFCTVYYASVRLENLLMAQGKLENGKKMLMEFSGKCQQDQRVMGCQILHTKNQKGVGITSSIMATNSKFLWRVPAHWTLLEASTVPLAYATAYFSLLIEGQMTIGDSILINYSGLGSNCGLGQALIGVALSLKIKSIFITIDNEEEKEFLKNIFQNQLQDKNFHFRARFEQKILEKTKGHGVNLVVSGNGNFFDEQDSFFDSSSLVKCLAEGGKFLQICTPIEKDLENQFEFGSLEKNFSFHKISIDSLLMAVQNSAKSRRLFDLVQQGIESGTVIPVASFKFSEQKMAEAFQFLEENKKEKISLEIRTENDEDNLNNVKKFKALSKLYFSPHKSFLIIGGLGGYGLELANWMIGRGVRKLLLVSRSGITTGYQHFCLEQWRELGVKVLCSKIDVANEEGAVQLLKEANRDLGPVGGIFNLAMVLSIDLMDKQTPERFESVTRCKIEATFNLDKVSRQLAPSLDYFVVFSSVSCGWGIPGQVNYGMGNSVMERICEDRRKQGLPGLAVQWGAVGDVGAVSEKFVATKAIVGKTDPQSIRSCLNTLELFMLMQSSQGKQTKCSPVLSSMVVARQSLQSTGESGQKLDPNFENGIKNSSSQTLTEKVGWILGMTKSDLLAVRPSTELLALGLDSLMSIELGQMLERDYGVKLSSEKIRKLTFEMLQIIQEANQNNSPSPSPSPGQPEPLSEEKIEMFEIPDSSSSLVNFDPPMKEPMEEGTKENLIIPQKNSLMAENGNATKNSNLTFTSLRYILLYILALFSILGLTLLVVLSLVLAQLTKIWLRIRFGSTRKLMDRPLDALFTYNRETSNMVIIMKCKTNGILDRKKFLENFRTQILNRAVVTMDEDGNEISKKNLPYDCLRWRIDKSNCLFYTWTLQDNFELENHIIFETTTAESSAAGFDEAGQKLVEFYLKHAWDDTKPQWEGKILTSSCDPKDLLNGEFIFVIALHHSYGDGVSFTHMVEYGMTDSGAKNSNSNPTSPATSAPPPQKIKQLLTSSSQDKMDDPAELRMKLKTLLVENFKFCLLFLHTLIVAAIDKYNEEMDCPKPIGSSEASTRTCRSFEIDLRKFRVVKLREEGEKIGKNVGLTSVVMTCIAETWKKIYEKNGKEAKCPKKIIFWTPYARYEKGAFSMENSFSTAWIMTPTSSDLSGLSTSTSTKNLLLRQIQENVTVSTQPNLLNVIYVTTAALSRLARPFLWLSELAPNFSLVFSNIILSTPTHSTDFRVLGGHQVTKFYGFPPIARGSVGTIGSIVDGDKVVLTMSVREGVMTQDCPNFVDQFTQLFEQQLESMADI